ncbi:MAG: hypothetical protein ACYTG0_40695 [Planctomycetota bacterium]|jgi:hypothetical protein
MTGLEQEPDGSVVSGQDAKPRVGERIALLAAGAFTFYVLIECWLLVGQMLRIGPS